MERIYINRKYDQWKKIPLIVEDEVNGYGLKIRVPDADITRGKLNSVMVEIKDKNSATYSVGCDVEDYNKNIIKFLVPNEILSNDGVYSLVLTISYNASGTKAEIVKSAIQTFEVIDTIKVDDGIIKQETNYPILIKLIEEISQYKVDTSLFPTVSEVKKLIEDYGFACDINNIIKEIETRGFINQDKLDRILREGYVSKFDSANFATVSDLNAFIKIIDFNKYMTNYATIRMLDSYIKKVEGKGLSTHDLTDELYNKLINMGSGGSGGVTRAEVEVIVNNLIRDRATIEYVNTKFAEIDLTKIDLTNYLKKVDAGLLYELKGVSYDKKYQDDNFAKKTEIIKINDIAHSVSETYSSSKVNTLFKNLGHIKSFETELVDNVTIDATAIIKVLQQDVVGINTRISNLVIPTKTSQLTNDIGFMTTVPQGYATESFVLDKIATANQFIREIVDFLPTVDIKSNVIYMILKTESLPNDIYDEYINLNGSVNGWELIGNTAIDLTQYAKVTDLNLKVDKIVGKGLSTNDYTTVEKVKLEGLANYTHPNDINTRHVTDVEKSTWNAKSNFSGNYTDLIGIPTQYTLPIASSTVLGGIKVGNGLSINQGVLSASGSVVSSVDWANIQNKPSVFTPSPHDHDTSYVAKEVNKGLSTNDYTTVEKTKLSGISESANNYIHPSTHVATIITEDETHRFVTDVEKTKWDKALPFDSTYIANANDFKGNGYAKTNESTANLPSQVTPKWGIIFHVQENSLGTGTQMYYPINGTQKGTIWVRSNVTSSWSSWAKLSVSPNELTNALKTNYDNAFTHSQSTHAPPTAQINNDITKAEIEAKLVGNITTHTHATSSMSDTLVTTNIVNSILTLTIDKYQTTTTMVNGTEIKLPTVTNFTEIHLFFNTTAQLTLILPTCKWQTRPVFLANKDYELILTYTDKWLGKIIEYA